MSVGVTIHSTTKQATFHTITIHATQDGASPLLSNANPSIAPAANSNTTVTDHTQGRLIIEEPLIVEEPSTTDHASATTATAAANQKMAVAKRLTIASPAGGRLSNTATPAAATT